MEGWNGQKVGKSESRNGLTVGKVRWLESQKGGMVKSRTGQAVAMVGKSECCNGWTAAMVGRSERWDGRKVGKSESRKGGMGGKSESRNG